jgi:hypothetical protein
MLHIHKLFNSFIHSFELSNDLIHLVSRRGRFFADEVALLRPRNDRCPPLTHPQMRSTAKVNSTRLAMQPGANARIWEILLAKKGNLGSFVKKMIVAHGF